MEDIESTLMMKISPGITDWRWPSPPPRLLRGHGHRASESASPSLQCLSVQSLLVAESTSGGRARVLSPACARLSACLPAFLPSLPLKSQRKWVTLSVGRSKQEAKTG